MDITSIVKAIMEQIKETVRSETVIGKPVQAEESVIIPISKVSFGFGVGGGSKDDTDKGSGSGAGCGATIEPVAFVVVSKGKAQLLPLKTGEAPLTRFIDLVPSLIDVVKDMRTKTDRKNKTEDEEKVKEKGKK